MKIGDVYYEKNTVTKISPRTNTVSETQVERVDAIPQTWTPVSEGLPKESENYQVTLSFDVGDKEPVREVCKAFYCSLSKKWSYLNDDVKKWLYNKVDVIAWMPLPKPYDPQKRKVQDEEIEMPDEEIER